MDMGNSTRAWSSLFLPLLLSQSMQHLRWLFLPTFFKTNEPSVKQRPMVHELSPERTSISSQGSDVVCFG